MGYRVVVAGATGNVGREVLNILAEREFPIDDLAVLASSRSTGDMVDYAAPSNFRHLPSVVKNESWLGGAQRLAGVESGRRVSVA